MDGLWYLWNYWWQAFAAHRGLSLYFTDWLIYPLGCHLGIDAFPTNLLFIVPFAMLFSPVGVWNAVAIASTVLTGVSGFYLGRFYAGSVRGGLLAGVFLAFCSARIGYLLWGCVDFAQFQWAVLLVLAAGSFFHADGRARGRVAFLALAILLATYHDQRVTFGTVLFIGFYAALWTAGLFLSRDAGRFEALKRLAVLGLLVGLASLPLFLYVMGLTGGQTSLVGRPPHWEGLFLVRLGRLFLPPPHHVLSGPGDFTEGTPEAAIGYLSPAAAILMAAAFSGPSARFPRAVFGILLALFLLFSASFWPVSEIPILNYARIPARFFAPFTVACGICVAVGWSRLERRIKGRTAKTLLFAVLAAVFFLETNPVLRRPADLPRHAFLEEVRREPGHFAVLDIPVGIVAPWIGRFDAMALARAVQHGRPIFSGGFSIAPPMTLPLVGTHPIYRALIACQNDGRCGDVDDAFFRRLKEELDVRYVITTNGRRDALTGVAEGSAALGLRWSDEQISVREIL